MMKRSEEFYSLDRLVKYEDFTKEKKSPAEATGMILMSGKEFAEGGKDLKGVPICVTPDGLPPKEIDEDELMREAEKDIKLTR